MMQTGDNRFEVDRNGAMTDKKAREEPLWGGEGVEKQIMMLEEALKKSREREGLLEANEEMLRALINATQETLILIDKTGRVLLANDMVARRLGATVGELVGSLIYSHFPPEVAGLRREHFDRVIATGKTVCFESVRADRIYEEHCYPVIDKDGAISQVAVFSADITERRHALDALRESEKKYRSIFENAMEGIFQTTPEGRFLSANPALAKMVGFPSPDHLLAAVTDIGRQLYVDPGDRVRLKDIFESQGFVEAFEVQLYTRGGGKIWISANARAVRDPQGTISYYEGTCEDITQRKETEKRLVESEERYRTAIEHSSDGVALVRGDQHIYVNQKFLEIFGYEKVGEIIGESHSLLVHPDDLGMVTRFNRMRQKGNPVPSKYEFKGRRRDGTTIYLEISAARTVYLGEPVTLAYFRDVTERKRLEEQLRSMSVMDELTSLYNRRGFLTLSEKQFELAKRSRKGMLLFFADLDDLKWINDTLGHQQGDRALVNTARILKATFRQSDIIGRMGGDEFAVLVINATLKTGKMLTTRLRNEIDALNRAGSDSYNLSLSVGVAHYDPRRPSSLEEMLTTADTLMYEEKRRKYQPR